MENGGYTIKVVAERTGVSLHTLRAWERRYGVPKPRRASGSQYRLYDEDDIADVMWLKRQVEQGMTPSQASAMLRAQGRGPLSGQTVNAISPRAQPLNATRVALEEALLESDAANAQQLLDVAFALFAPEQVALEVIGPVMQAIGERWMKTENAVWQEHFASNLMRQRILSILQAQSPTRSGAPVLLAACAPDEQHELGLLVFALLTRRQGWGVSYLGQRTPFADLMPAARAAQAQVIVLSATSPDGLASLIPLFSGHNQLELPLAFGGAIINRVAALQNHLPGDFAGADARDAVSELDRLTRPAEHWSPPKRLLLAALELRDQRLQLAGETATRIIEQAGSRGHIPGSVLAEAAVHLIDTLACALAFDAPEIVDDQAEWVQSALPQRGVTTAMRQAQLDAFTAASKSRLSRGTGKLAIALLDRLALPVHNIDQNNQISK